MIMPKVTLNTLIPGERCVIERIESGTMSVRQRLLEMGLTKGTNVELIRFAPMGDPIEISVRGYRLSLRRTEAESVIVSKNSHQ
jgi:Fe2+ transport system protein A